MKYLTHTLVLTIGAVFLFRLIIPTKAYAYLDPGSGSYFLQLGLAALLGILFAVKLFWKKIKGFINNLVAGEGRHAGSKDW